MWLVCLEVVDISAILDILLHISDISDVSMSIKYHFDRGT